MTQEYSEPSKAQLLASLVSGKANVSGTNATVQRSHRFPLHLFIQIENMARISEVPVSVIINQLIECGLEAVSKELPQQIVEQLSICTTEQLERPLSSTDYGSKARKTSPRSKSKAAK